MTALEALSRIGRMEPTTVAPSGAPLEEEVEQVLRWRLSQLRRAGYSAEEASLLAGEADVDLHRAIELAHRGCPTQTALRILL